MKAAARDFVVCESTAAVATHLREVTDLTPIKLGGHSSPRPLTLCSTEAAWDTRSPISAVRCPRCREKAGI